MAGEFLSPESIKLSSIYRKRARKELNEDSKQIQAHLTSFKRWISSMPHLKCPTDDKFLLAFLRHAKYSHSKAQTRLDNFCTFRTSPIDGCPHWFVSQENDTRQFRKLLDLKISLPLGFTENGAFVVLVKPANYGDFAMPINEASRLNTKMDDLLILDERIQISGCLLVIDFTGMTMKQAKAIFSVGQNRVEGRYRQECMPMRTDKLIFYNMPSFFEGLFKVILHYLKEKIRQKVLVLNGGFQEGFDIIPGLKKIMPREYGGDALPFDQLCDSMKDNTIKAFDDAKRLDITVDESKRPDSAKNLMSAYVDIPESLMGTSGTFVKLNSDEI